MRDLVAIWEKLRGVCRVRGFSARFYLWKKLFALRLAGYRGEGQEAIESNIDDCKSYYLQLRDCGAHLDNAIEAL